METLTLKRCPSCGQSLELSCFHKDKSTSDGLCAYCKVCRKAKAAVRYARPEVKWPFATAGLRYREMES